IGAYGEITHRIVFFFQRRENKDLYIGIIKTDHFYDLKAVSPGHPDIANKEVKFFFLQDINKAIEICTFTDQNMGHGFLDKHSYAIPDDVMIISEEDSHWFSLVG